MSIHYRAMAHLEAARGLLASADEAHLRYAALELRYCIEHLFYELIPLYKDELPDSVVGGAVWRPAEIIDMIVAIDPGVHEDRSLRMGLETSPGVPAPQLFSLGRQSGLRRDLARRLYHGLGFYLHARIDQQPHNAARLRRHLERLIPALERFEGDRILISGFDPRSTFNCTECGRPIRKRLINLAKNPLAVCPNERCGAVFKTLERGEAVEHQLLQETFECPACHSDNWIGIHLLRRGARSKGRLTCRGCSRVYRVIEAVSLVPEEDTHSAQVPAGAG